MESLLSALIPVDVHGRLEFPGKREPFSKGKTTSSEAFSFRMVAQGTFLSLL